MYKHRIVGDFTESGLDKIIQELRQYQRDLDKKVELFVSELTKIGTYKITSILQKNVDTGQTIGSVKVVMNDNFDVTSAEIVVSSDSILFLEFGAGIRYNQTKKNPKADELGYGVGTYPNQTHAFDENGWWYQKEQGGKWYHSYGVEATMPMYKGALEIRKSIKKVAKGVFS